MFPSEFRLGPMRWIAIYIENSNPSHWTKSKFRREHRKEAGTTVMGMFDPLFEIGKVCKKYDIWLHVDGAYGGVFIFSELEEKKALLKGLDKADSFTFNFHKTFESTRCITVFVTKHKDILRKAAPPPSRQYYGIQTGLYNRTKYDIGEYHVAVDRRPDIFKLFLLWKAKGTKGLGQHVDQGFHLTDYAYKQILSRSKQTGNFQPVMKRPPENANVNFIYIPDKLRGANQNAKDFKQKISYIQNTILACAIFNGKFVQAVEAYDNNKPEHIVLYLYNTALTEKDVDYFLDVVEYYGRHLKLELVLQMAENAGSDGGTINVSNVDQELSPFSKSHS